MPSIVEVSIDGKMEREEQWMGMVEKKDEMERMLSESRTRKRFTYKMTKNK